MISKASKAGHRPDYFLLAIVALLTIAGLVILASASSDLGKIRFGDSYYYLKHQLLYGLSVGILGFLFAYKLRYQYFKKFAFILLLLNLGLLAMVFTPLGRAGGGASRWLYFGPILFQPAELLKLTFLIYLAAWLVNPKMNRVQNLTEGVLPFFIICGVIGGLLLLQPATSTVIILIGSGIVVYFVSGARLWHILAIGFAGALILGIVIFFTPYRLGRIMTYLDPQKDATGSSYQVNQALLSIGSGGLWGVGYGQSTNKMKYLPTPTDDSIFAVVAQELGFAGASALVILFGMLIFRLLWIAKDLRDKFGQLLMVGFASIIGLQSIVNMGAISGLLPLTGVPLPFISAGGTALAVFLTMSGIAVNISKYTS